MRAICVYRTAALGDFVLTIPALLQLRNEFPNHYIIFLTASSSDAGQRAKVNNYLGQNRYPLWINLLPQGVVNKVISVENPYSLNELMGLKKVISKYDVDFTVCMVDVGSPMINRIKKWIFLTIVVGVRRVYGLGSKGVRNGKNELELKKRGDLPHHVFGPMQFLVDIGKIQSVTDASIDFIIDIKEESVLKAKGMLVNVKNLDNAICISMGAIKKHKKWPLKNFDDLIKKILEDRPNLSIVLVGSKADATDAEAVWREHKNIVNLVGKTSILELAAIFKLIPRLISNDGGSAHLADAVGATVVTITPGIEVTDSIEPYRNICRSIRSYTECYPCYNFDDCPNGTYACTTNISVERVFAEVKKMFI
jgi:heptosyltransferase-2